MTITLAATPPRARPSWRAARGSSRPRGRRRTRLNGGAAAEGGPQATWEEYLAEVQAMTNPDELRPLVEIIANYRESMPDVRVADFDRFLSTSLDSLTRLIDEVRAVRSRT